MAISTKKVRITTLQSCNRTNKAHTIQKGFFGRDLASRSPSGPDELLFDLKRH